MKVANSNKLLTRKLSRRKFIAASSVVLSAPMIASGLTRQARAANDGTVRVLLSAPTFVPESWDLFEAETGMKIEVDLIKDDSGVYLNEVMVNDAGDRYDIISAISGVEKTLSDGGYILPLDTAALSNWSDMSVPVRDMDMIAFNDAHWAVPLTMNADSFGYAPDKLGLPIPPEEVSWATVYDNPDAMGRTSIGDNFFSLIKAIVYATSVGIIDDDDPGNPSVSSIKKGGDFLIERKKAGQFRNFWSTFDDQVSNFKNNEVDAQECWEPAAKAGVAAGRDLAYADAKEFYVKWAHTLAIPAQVVDRGTQENAYKAIDWFMSGAYAAQITPKTGYVTARPDLGKEYAKSLGMQAETTAALDAATDKVKNKFSKELFWFNGLPDNTQELAAEMNRVLAV
ncbi:extracellular solute-binding protein [Ruegeria sp. 2012CJ41-6]|uniref:Extracellular solute-binding protein n=1 Tax=Ruegeria spongiae TaxID=2942209 RepID=A0ABT0Q6Q8_9RHOB|nr:extracellular solute-binding protein [Ruegeria spongiae]MCL6285077.1 extracellular solute-binding protein [Ruegeria spongiae]